jgi:ElaB/YqjD/DUF883 family membrane-anchored ribosome-binding protein
MRRTRLGQSRAFTQRLIFVAIALAFVGSGYLIGRYFLASLLQKPAGGEPVSGTQKPVPQGTTATVQVQTKPVTFYRVQIGAFSAKENADKAVETAAQKGVGAGVMAPDPLYKVYCGITGSKEAADRLSQNALPKLAGSVVGKNDDLYVASANVASRSFSVTGDKALVEKLQDAFAESDNATQSLLTFWDSQYLGKQNQVNLAAMEADLASLRDDLQKAAPPEALKNAHSAALKVLSDLALAVKGAREAAGGDGGKVASATSAFIKSVDTYIQELKKLSP